MDNLQKFIYFFCADMVAQKLYNRLYRIVFEKSVEICRKNQKNVKICVKYATQSCAVRKMYV